MSPATGIITNVAIVGASGRVGGYFARSLLATGKHNVIALTRSSSSSSKSLPSGIKVLPVDYDNETSFVDALKSNKVEFIAITLPARSQDTHSQIVSAAIKAGVKYIMPNAYGGDFMNEKLRAKVGGDLVTAGSWEKCQDIKNQGGTYIGMVCAHWYEWSLALGEPWYGIDIPNRTATFFDDGNIKINSSTWQQCGNALAALLSLPESGASPCVADWANKPFYLASFKISQRDMLDSVHRVMGTMDKDWTITHEETKKRYDQGLEDMKKGDIRGYARAMYTRKFFPDGVEDYEGRNGLVNGALGLPKEDLDEATKRTVEMLQSGWNPFKEMTGGA